MLLGRFKRTDLLTIFLIVVILISLWVGAMMKLRGQFFLYFDIDSMPLYGLISSFTGTHPLPGVILSLLLVSVVAFLMVNLNTALIFISERTFLPAVFYVLLSGLFPQYQLMNPAIAGTVFLMFAVKRIMESHRVQGTAFNYFDAGILVSAGSLLYANIIWFGIIIFIGIALLRTINTKEIVLTVIGLITPFIITAALYYVAGKDPFDFFRLFEYNLFGRQTVFAFNTLLVGAMIFTGLLTFAGILRLFFLMGGMKVQSRKTFALLLWILFISVFLYFANPAVSVEMMWIAAVPVSYILSNYFIHLKRKIISEILFDLFFILILMIQLLYHG
jgi:hypothetical protein